MGESTAMKRMETTVGAFLWCAVFALPLIGAQAEQPNIVVFLTDDQGAWATGCYGNPDIHTPNIDRLAEEGVLFTRAFTPTPVCSPSRVAFFTGRYGAEVGIYDWLSPRAEPRKGLPPSVITWPELLRQHGYRTGLFGKWHLGLLPQHHPTRRGFDQFVGFRSGGNRPMDPVLEVDGKEQRFKGPLPDILTEHAIRFIEENADRPFLVCVSFRAPHAPYGPVPEVDRRPYVGLSPRVPAYPGLDLDRVRKLTLDYYASITSVDRNVGRLLRALDRLKLDRRTVVFFTSDHGYNIGHHGLLYKGNAYWLVPERRRERRPNMFDTSIRVPLIVRWRGAVPAGRRVDAMVSFIDIFRTMAELAGVAVPDRPIVHGRSFWPLVLGKHQGWRNALYGEYDMHHGAIARMRMIRTERWKLIVHHEDRGLDELYDLEADPQEQRNLAHEPQYRETYRQLLSELAREAASLRPLLP